MVEVHLGALGSRGDLRRKGQWEEIRINSKRQEIKGFEAGSLALGSGLEKTVIPDHTRVWVAGELRCCSLGHGQHFSPHCW